MLDGHPSKLCSDLHSRSAGFQLISILTLFMVGSCAVPSLAAPSLQVLQALTAESTPSLLQNGSFEQGENGKAPGWREAPKRFETKLGEGRNGSRAIVCQNESGNGWFGASQTLALDRSTTAPLVIEGWSKAANVTGGSDNDYSLYADLIYADGTTLWGQAARFRAGTHDWQQRRLVIFPQKPVKTLTLHCLFRNHGGTVWFDDVSVRESRSSADAMTFQGVAVKPARLPPAEEAHSGRIVRSDDGLQLVLSDSGRVSWVQIGGRRFFHQGLSGGFMVRDAAAESGFCVFRNGQCGDLQLKLSAETRAASNHIAVQGRITDITGRDRAITLVYTIPLDAKGWTWGDDLRRTRTISGTGEFVNQVAVPCGATGTQSLYPMAAVWDSQTGAAVALDMARPAVCRLGYHAGLNRLFIAFDLGLAKETERFPSSADFSFVLFHFDPANGFRGAWQKFMDIFPDHFVVRSKEQGLWMPFTDVARVQRWEDFGFRYHEGNNAVAWDDAHGVLSFRYTEPMTWWMPMAKEVPRVLSEALRIRDALAESRDSNRRRMAEITRAAAMSDEAGEPALLFRNEPWANGAVWSLNPNPWLGVAASTNAFGRSDPPLNAGTVHWNPEIKERLYGAAAKGSLDGEYSGFFGRIRHGRIKLSA